MNVETFVFIDESALSTNLTRKSGRCFGSARLDAPVPAGSWHTTTFVAGLRTDGITAPFVMPGPMTGEAFLTWLHEVLIPELRAGDVVVMDNLACHKAAGVREALNAAGASVMYLPPCSPDPNPVGQVFSKLKALLRRASARTKETLWDATGEPLKAFTPQECQNFISNVGYA